jgi:hypothetical protein
MYRASDFYFVVPLKSQRSLGVSPNVNRMAVIMGTSLCFYFVVPLSQRSLAVSPKVNRMAVIMGTVVSKQVLLLMSNPFCALDWGALALGCLAAEKMALLRVVSSAMTQK